MNNSIISLYDLAAIQIQAAWRGWWVRDCINVDNYCARVIQKNTRLYLLKSRIERQQRERKAAILIQSIWRSHNVRKKGILENLKRRRNSLTKEGKSSHSEKTLKTGSRRQKNQLMREGLNTNHAKTEPSRPLNIRKQSSRGSKDDSSRPLNIQRQTSKGSRGDSSRPLNVQRQTSKGSRSSHPSSHNMSAMHTDDLVRRWKEMRERNKRKQNLAEF